MDFACGVIGVALVYTDVCWWLRCELHHALRYVALRCVWRCVAVVYVYIYGIVLRGG